MSINSTQSLNYNSYKQGKDTGFIDQFNRVYRGFFEQPQSMKMF